MVGTRSSSKTNDSTPNDLPEYEEIDKWSLPALSDSSGEDEEEKELPNDHVTSDSLLPLQVNQDESNKQHGLQGHSVNSSRSFLQNLNSAILQDKTFLGTATETHMLRQYDGNSKGYNNDKSKTVAEFFYSLAQHASLRVLTEWVALDEPMMDGTTKIRRFFVELRGTDDINSVLHKKAAINNALVWFFKNRFMKTSKEINLSTATPQEIAKARYKVSSLQQTAKKLFKVFKDNGIIYQAKDFQGMPGSFQAWVQHEATQTLQHRPDYGDRKVAQFDPQAPYKLRSVDWNLDDPKLLLNMMAYRVIEQWGLRGAREVSTVPIST